MDTKITEVDIDNGARNDDDDSDGDDDEDNDDDDEATVGESNSRQQAVVVARPDRQQLSQSESLKRNSVRRKVMAPLPK